MPPSSPSLEPYTERVKNAAPRPMDFISVWAVTAVLIIIVVAVVVWLALMPPMI